MAFIDGTGITPGSEKCVCTDECEFPCWQRIGWAPACSQCGCLSISSHAEAMEKAMADDDESA